MEPVASAIPLTFTVTSVRPLAILGKHADPFQVPSLIHVRGYEMRLRSLTAVVAALAVAVVVHGDEKEKTQPKVKPAQGSVVGNLVCSKCNFKATEKCQTALQLDAHKFVIVSGKAGEDLFKARCSGKLVRVSGAVTLKDGLVTIKGAKSSNHPLPIHRLRLWHKMIGHMPFFGKPTVLPH